MLFLARDRYTSMLSALYAVDIGRLSVCPSHGCIIEKRLKLGLWFLVFVG